MENNSGTCFIKTVTPRGFLFPLLTCCLVLLTVGWREVIRTTTIAEARLMGVGGAPPLSSSSVVSASAEEEKKSFVELTGSSEKNQAKTKEEEFNRSSAGPEPAGPANSNGTEKLIPAALEEAYVNIHESVDEGDASNSSLPPSISPFDLHGVKSGPIVNEEAYRGSEFENIYAEGKRQKIECAQNWVLEIVRATWGPADKKAFAVSDRSGANDPSFSCPTTDVTRKLASKCQGLEVCNFVPNTSNDWGESIDFGDDSCPREQERELDVKAACWSPCHGVDCGEGDCKKLRRNTYKCICHAGTELESNKCVTKK